MPRDLGDYLGVLVQGHGLPDDERERVAKELMRDEDLEGANNDLREFVRWALESVPDYPR